MLHTPSLPRYIQIRDALHRRIREGDLQPGEKLPSEDQLAVEFGVSRMTMRRSLGDLIDAGLIYRRHGLGTFISKTTIERDHSRLTDFFESCRLSGHVPDARLLYKESKEVPVHIAHALSLQAGEPVIRLATLRSVDGSPITYHDAYLPAYRFPDLLVAEPASLNLDSQHVWQLIEAQGYTVANVVEKLEAQIADRALAGLLEIKAGDPILYGQRVLYSDDGIPLKYADCYNRGDRFSLTVVLAR